MNKPGHCGHAPKCINVDPTDERDPLGCCNCGTRETKTKAPNVESDLQSPPEPQNILDGCPHERRMGSRRTWELSTDDRSVGDDAPA